jgi:hypothetical protein
MAYLAIGLAAYAIAGVVALRHLARNERARERQDIEREQVLERELKREQAWEDQLERQENERLDQLRRRLEAEAWVRQDESRRERERLEAARQRARRASSAHAVREAMFVRNNKCVSYLGGRHHPSGLEAGNRRILFPTTCDIVFAIGESEDGRVHGGLVLNGSQYGGFKLSWMNDATFDVLILHRVADGIKVSGCDKVADARSLLCSYVDGSKFVTRVLTRVDVDIAQLASYMQQDLTMSFEVSVWNLDVYNDTNCLLFVARAAAAAGVPLENFQALVPAALELSCVPSRLRSLIADAISSYSNDYDISNLISSFTG